MTKQELMKRLDGLPDSTILAVGEERLQAVSRLELLPVRTLARGEFDPVPGIRHESPTHIVLWVR